MNKKIVIINGNGGVGKDTFVNMCSLYKKVKKASSVDLIKKSALILGWQATMKSDTDRKFLADLKDLSTKYNDYPFNYLLYNVEEFNKDENDILFLFIREISEINRMLNKIDAVTLLITKSNKEFITSNEADANVLNYEYDYIIENNNEEELKEKAKSFVDSLFNK